VLLAARSADKLDELTATIAADGGHAVSYPADISDEAAVAELAKRICAEHGAPDIVVNNAGKSIRRSLHEQYERSHDFDRTIGVNYLGPIRLLLELVPEMRRRGSGHIVNVSSVGVRTPPGPRWGAYQASKGAFDMWLRSVAPELHADGVDVTSVYFGLINTRMMEPTKSLRNAPGLSAEQAADIVAKAITDRPRTIAPWWLWPAEVATVVLRAPVERATQGVVAAARQALGLSRGTMTRQMRRISPSMSSVNCWPIGCPKCRSCGIRVAGAPLGWRGRQ